ncbi:MAG TPA: hypothetical protein PLH11_09635, partial [Gemmobacter sp.]|nr:hypothetical protein [Gemmobacter sp.]
TLFLLSDRIDPNAAIPYAEVDVEDLARDPRMTAPAYAGTTRDGATVNVTASLARPANEGGASEGGASAEDVRAELATPDGARSTLSAAGLRFSSDAAQAVLEGGVLISQSLGYEFRTDSLTLNLDRTGLQSAGAVEGYGPIGQLIAGRMTLTPAESADGRYLLVFNEGVRLIYQPGKSADTP